MAKRAKRTASPVKETRFSDHLRCHRTAYSLFHILIRIPAEQHIQKEKQYQRGGGCSQPHRCSQYHGTQLVYAETYPISKYILIKDCKQNHFLDCICWAMVAMAARHGESRRLNTRKENAAATLGTSSGWLLPPLQSPPPWTHPRWPGHPWWSQWPLWRKIRKWKPPPAARSQSPAARRSSDGAAQKGHKAVGYIFHGAEASVLKAKGGKHPHNDAGQEQMVPAFLIKPQSLSQVCMSTVLADGIWYAGSSITKGAASPENGFVFFKMMADTSTAATPMKYMRGAI